MKKIFLILSIFLVGCSNTEIVRNGMYEGTRQIREEHLRWTHEFASTQPNLPHFSETDVRIREELHKEYEAFNKQAGP